LLPLLTVALACLAPARAHAIDPVRDRWEFLDPRDPNQVYLDAMTLGDYAGVGIGYRRGLGRHMSLGAQLEYAYPNPGYAHLVGFGHTVEVVGWLERPWTGVYFAATVTVGHQFAVSLPGLSSVALGGGASMGWSWDLTRHANLAFSGGLRRMGVVHRSTQICTVPGQCIFIAEGFRPRFTVTFGYRF
jgi:hypothetical protein